MRRQARIFWPRLLCEPYDDTTPCPVRVFAAIAFVVYHVGMVYGVAFQNLILSSDVLGNYLTHMSIFTGASGLSLGAKSFMHGDAPQPGDKQP